MKIVHVCLTGVFTEGWTYQENLLSKYHSRLGYDVTVIASSLIYDKNGEKNTSVKSGYKNDDGVFIIRLEEKRHNPNRKFRRFPKLYSTLVEQKPDILFVHSCQFLDINVILKYKKLHEKVKLYIDNHADFSNSAKNFFSYYFLHKVVWKTIVNKIEPYTKKFYGVMPARVDFLIQVYDLPEQKVELLVMGADDEKVTAALEPEVRKRIRKQYAFKDADFLIVSGGKIDNAKKQTLLLMEAVNRIENVKLLIFGSVIDELKEKINSLCSDRVKYIGWLDSGITDQYFAAADLVVFPGRHSVFWEQVAGLGIPMLVKDWAGTHHIDVGGNVKFIENDSVDEIEAKLRKIIEKDYERMKRVAQKKAMKEFSYMEIARRSIEENVE